MAPEVPQFGPHVSEVHPRREEGTVQLTQVGDVCPILRYILQQSNRQLPLTSPHHYISGFHGGGGEVSGYAEA